MSTLPVPNVLGLLALVPNECHFCLEDMEDTLHALCAPLDSCGWASLMLSDSGHRKALRSKGVQNQIPRSETTTHKRVNLLSSSNKFLLLAVRADKVKGHRNAWL